MNEVQQVIVIRQGTGVTAGVIASVLAVLGIFTLGVIFIPIAATVALIGTIIAVKNGNGGGIGVNLLAWVLAIVGLFSSPVLLTVIGVLSV